MKTVRLMPSNSLLLLWVSIYKWTLQLVWLLGWFSAVYVNHHTGQTVDQFVCCCSRRSLSQLQWCHLSRHLLAPPLGGSCYRAYSGPIYFTHKSRVLLCIEAVLSLTFLWWLVCAGTFEHNWDNINNLANLCNNSRSSGDHFSESSIKFLIK